MKKLGPSLLLAALLGGCIVVPPPPNRSAIDPAEPSAPEAATPRSKENLIAGTRVYLDPAVGEGAQKMDHSKMQGMGGMGDMKGMDHSKMPGMQGKQEEDQSKPESMEKMPGMDHSKMPGMSGKKDDAMPGMKHDAEPAKGDAAKPADKEATVEEMKKTADEMKKASDELKAKSDALQKRRGKKPGATPSPQQPAKPEDHSQHQQ